MKKVLVFLVGCAIGYGCWLAFSNSDSTKVETEQVATDSVDLTISVKNEIKATQGDSITVQDTLSVDTVVAE